MSTQPKYEHVVIHIEDMEQFRTELRKDLISIGFNPNKIYQVEDLMSFIKLVKNLKPDLIICDWNLPDGTGFDLLKKIKGVPTLRDIPFVLCTTMDEINNILDAIAAGASEYVVKPWKRDELEKKLKVVLKVK